jgi:hypothetical protein
MQKQESQYDGEDTYAQALDHLTKLKTYGIHAVRFHVPSSVCAIKDVKDNNTSPALLSTLYFIL